MMKIISSSSFNLNSLLNALIIPGLLLMSACGGGAGEAEKVQVVSNKAPDVNAGADQSVSANDDVRIAASASDSDGTVEFFSWTQISGASVSLTGADTANASFVAPADNSQNSIQVAFRITATDDKGSSATDTVTVTVTQAASSNTAPTVSAGQDQSVQENDNVTLPATASDSDGTIQSYSWTQLSGTNVNIDSANSSTASFTAPAIANGQSQTSLSFQIQVTDNGGATSTDSISVTVSAQQTGNIAPTVSAGNDVTVFEQTNVTLIATASDSDGNINSYSWVQTGGNSLTLNNSTSAEASFTSPTLADQNTPENYVFDITITDDLGLTATDSITVTVQASASTEDCTLTISPGEIFADAFDQLSAGQTLCLNDGKYVQAMDIPSNIYVRAVNDGMAEIDGQSTLGETWTGGLVQMKGSNSSVRGLRVHHAGENSDACNIAGTNNTMRVMSCSHGGDHKHKIPLKIGGSGHLIEDSWFFGEGRHITQAFYASDITFRRIVARPGLAVNAGQSEPRTGNVLYSTDESIVENSIVLDGATQSVTQFYKAFSVAAHNVNGDVNPPSNNKWMGNFAINMPDGSDGSYGASGITIDPDSNVGGSGGTIENMTVRGARVGVHILGGATDYTVTGCSLNDLAGAQVTIGSIPAPTTTVNNCDSDSAEAPAKRYIDGTKTDELLFPFPNEDLIKRDMCAQTERQSDWCLTDKTLSEYVQGL